MRLLALVVLALAAAAILLELGLRFGLGVGRPVLFVEHPRIEYLPAPNQDLTRFGRRQVYDELGRRSAPAANDARRRVLVLGDSVLNGGNPTDQSELATSLLSAPPSDVRYLNASAGSWGPANERAWLEEFGLGGARTVVLVLSSHDWTDAPTFDPLDPNLLPVRPPPFALAEAVQRYGGRVLPEPLARALRPERVRHAGRDDFDARAHPSVEEELRMLAARVAAEGARLCVVLHRERGELEPRPNPGGAAIEALFTELSVPVVDLRDGLVAARAAGQGVYRDFIHIDAAGQRVLADGIERCDGAATVPSVEPQSSPEK